MAYLAPHFKPDVFVSYSHGNSRAEIGYSLKDWTQAFIRRLESYIFSLQTDFSDLDLFIDREIDPTAYLTEELREKARASGVLLIVMSQHYLESSWCRDEREWFREQILDRAADAGRVFVVRAQDTDESRWPDFLRDERGYAIPGFEFYDSNDGQFPLGWPNFSDTKGDFERPLRQLQTRLVARMRELRNRVEKRAQVRAEAAARAAPSAQSAERRIYLYAPPDSDAVREDIHLALKGDGIETLTLPVSPGGLASWQRDASAARREAAKRCDALALLRTDDSERFVGDLIDIGVDERRLIAAARGAPMPCAVLDKTGADLRFDPSYGIERFDVNRDAWRGQFRAWLDSARPAPAAVAS